MSEATSLATSSEYLRLALPLMSKYGVPVTPPNYLVWYEYVSGSNVALKEFIDEMIKNGEELNADVTAKIYRDHLDPSDPTRIQAAQEALRVLAETVSSSLASANDEVSRYEESLNDCSSKINDDMSVDQVRALVSDLTDSTTKMNEGSAELQRDLEESRKEAETLREELEKARAEAKTDALTGLANRKAFDERVEQMDQAEERANGEHCVLIADIDKFKSINDTYGHLFGDKVIKAVATALTHSIKGKDMAARYGGEEFVVLLPETDLNGAKVVAESIRTTVENGRIVKPKTGEEIRRVTISIGVTQYGSDETIKEAISRADEALYRAKETGRNRVEVNPLQVPVAAVSRFAGSEA